MGTSFVRRHGTGFWANDSVLELWLWLLADEVDRLPDAAPWLLAARDYWRLHATAGFSGWVTAGLDEYAGTPERAAAVLLLVEEAAGRLRSLGPSVPASWLNPLGLGGPGADWGGDLPVTLAMPTGDGIARLLRGEALWDAADAPML